MHIIIIGAGQAAAQAISSLAQGGFDGTIALIGEETHLPYQRPPLSKKFMTGEMDEARLYFRPAAFYDQNNVKCMLNMRVTKIDPAEKKVTLANDDNLTYDKLIIATGSRPRKIPLTGSDAARVFDLRTIDDINRIKPYCQKGCHIGIIGGGYIGLETAAAAKQLGVDVTVYEAAPRVLARVTTPEMSDFFMRLHHKHGVQIKTACQIDRIETENGKATGIAFADGQSTATDAIIMGVGIVPNTELAQAAGLAIDNGIVVDDVGRCSVADIYAAGDCTTHPNALLDTRLRLESVPNAIEQAKAVVSDILGTPTPYHHVPWFWSDQYDVKLQIVGLSADATTHYMRGDINTQSFAIFYFKGDTLIALDAVNRGAEFMAGRKLVEASLRGKKIDPALLCDETIKPKQWLEAIA